MTKQTRRRFSPEYKEQSVARLSEPGATHNSVAAELGVTPTQLKTWRLEHRLPDAGTGQEGNDHRSGRIAEKPPGPGFGGNVEWHPGELYPRVGFIVTNLTRPAKRVVAFYNQRGPAEQHIKEGKTAIVWTRLSCRRFRNNEGRLQLHALAYNLANFMRTLALPEAVKHWSLTSLQQKLVKSGARIVGHGRSVTFQMAEVAVPRGLFDEILRLIAQLRAPPAPA